MNFHTEYPNHEWHVRENFRACNPDLKYLTVRVSCFAGTPLETLAAMDLSHLARLFTSNVF